MRGSLFVLPFLGLAWILVLLHPIEPSHAGRVFANWIPDLLEHDPFKQKAAVEAILTMRFSALPRLRGLLRQQTGLRSVWGPRLGQCVPARMASWSLFEPSLPEKQIELLMAVSVLGTNAAPAFPETVRLLYTPNCEVNRAALHALASLGLPFERVQNPLHDALRNLACYELRADAAAWVGTNFSGHAAALVPALVNLLADPFTDVRAAAANALGRIGVPARAAVPNITILLDDSSPTVRMSAALALRRLGPGSSLAVTKLIRLLKDEDAGVRRESAKALEVIGPGAAAAVPALMAALRDPELHVQISAIEALGGIGPAAKSAVQALKEARNNNQSGVGRQVLVALDRIDPAALE